MDILLGLIIIVSVLAALVFLVRTLNLKKRNEALESELQSLRPYAGVRNAEAKAQQMIVDAQRVAEQTKGNAESQLETANSQGIQIVAKAQEQAAQTVQDAKEKTKANQDKSEMALHSAHEKATEIIQNAKARAEEIAGEAMAAKGNADEFKKTARAMKNSFFRMNL